VLHLIITSERMFIVFTSFLFKQFLRNKIVPMPFLKNGWKKIAEKTITIISEVIIVRYVQL
jgi:hypothetical protein